MHYYQHNIADFNNATRHLTRVERSLYRDMIEMYYDKEQPLPLDENQLFRRVLAITDEEKQAVKNVLADFFVLSDEGWRHERCDTEIEAYHAKQEQQSRAGKASAAKRSNRKHTTDEPTNNQQSTNVERPLNGRSTTDEPTNNHKPITNNHKPIEASIVENSNDIGSLCLAIRGLGFLVTENDQRQKLPEIRELVGRGAKLHDFADYLEKAKAKNAKKPFGLAISIMVDEFGKPKPNARASPKSVRSFNDASLADALAQQAANNTEKRAIEA